jgi:Putative MetA-pathway of phenol degradation
MHVRAMAACLAVMCVVGAREAHAQGCVCQKQGLPVFGGLETYLVEGQWQVVLSYRGYESDEHFQGKDPFPILDPNGPRNSQQQLAVDLSYAFSPRFSLSVSSPFFANGFDVRRPGPAEPTPYFQDTDAGGLGDMSARANFWLLSTDRPDRNIGVSAGVKFPTGKNDATGTVSSRTVPVDVSIQTGDGTWGMTTSAYAFKSYDRLALFATGQYLFQPENTTGVYTFFGSLVNPNNTTENSAADQFSSQVGFSYQVARAWPVPTLAYRIEGVPVSDVFGDSDGFRRPGVIGFIEPGVTYGIAGNMMSFSVAIRNYVNIKDSPTSTRVEDATVPKYMFLAAYSRRF